jgi:hypothetical protein
MDSPPLRNHTVIIALDYERDMNRRADLRFFLGLIPFPPAKRQNESKKSPLLLDNATQRGYNRINYIHRRESTAFFKKDEKGTAL